MHTKIWTPGVKEMSPLRLGLLQLLLGGLAWISLGSRDDDDDHLILHMPHQIKSFLNPERTIISTSKTSLFHYETITFGCFSRIPLGQL